MMKTTLLAAAAVLALAGSAVAAEPMHNYETTYEDNKSIVYSDAGQDTTVNSGSDAYAGAVVAAAKGTHSAAESESPYTSQPDPTKISQ